MNKDIFKNKVYQKISGSKNGDCMKCCLATLFNTGYDDIENFIEYTDWFTRIKRFLKNNGYYIDKFLYNNQYFGRYIKHKYDYFTDEINDKNINSSNGVNVGGKKIMLGTVIGKGLYNSKKQWEQKTLHMVLCDEKFNIVFDPNTNIISGEYPLKEEIGYNGLIEIWTLKKYDY